MSDQSLVYCKPMVELRDRRKHRARIGYYCEVDFIEYGSHVRYLYDGLLSDGEKLLRLQIRDIRGQKDDSKSPSGIAICLNADDCCRLCVRLKIRQIFQAIRMKAPSPNNGQLNGSHCRVVVESSRLRNESNAPVAHGRKGKYFRALPSEVVRKQSGRLYRVFCILDSLSMT